MLLVIKFKKPNKAQKERINIKTQNEYSTASSGLRFNNENRKINDASRVPKPANDIGKKVIRLEMA